MLPGQSPRGQQFLGIGVVPVSGGEDRHGTNAGTPHDPLVGADTEHVSLTARPDY